MSTFSSVKLYQKSKFKACKIVTMTVFNPLKLAKIDFTESQSSRKIAIHTAEYPQAKIPIRLPRSVDVSVCKTVHIIVVDHPPKKGRFLLIRAFTVFYVCGKPSSFKRKLLPSRKSKMAAIKTNGNMTPQYCLLV